MKKLICALLLLVILCGCTPASPENGTNSSEEPSATAAADLSENQSTVPQTVVTAPTKYVKPETQPKVTLVTTRATSPHHLTQRPTTQENTTQPRSTSNLTRPTHTTRTTRPHSTPTTPVRTTRPRVEVELDIAVDYGGVIECSANNVTAKVKLVGHSFEMTERNTVAVTLTVETVERAPGEGKGVTYIAFNCYGADGKLLNEKPLTCVVPVGEAGAQTKTIITAPNSTKRIEFVKYS